MSIIVIIVAEVIMTLRFKRLCPKVLEIYPIKQNFVSISGISLNFVGR